ncbi:Protein CBG27872 [Caenorhabditis briggsae]|uniref:Protein CBG27872 n=1 Tax=Caenorhabditis briggsae TaxID=6238 RepID=B6IEG7_CAEBR|nr:Protein CBG27872 [Caenorhabditis briggsae]CAR98297.1 Protein CBG27872 [Caenorhabditis briggsae]
MYYRSRAVL